MAAKKVDAVYFPRFPVIWNLSGWCIFSTNPFGTIVEAEAEVHGSCSLINVYNASNLSSIKFWHSQLGSGFLIAFFLACTNGDCWFLKKREAQFWPMSHLSGQLQICQITHYTYIICSFPLVWCVEGRHNSQAKLWPDKTSLRSLSTKAL